MYSDTGFGKMYIPIVALCPVVTVLGSVLELATILME